MTSPQSVHTCAHNAPPAHHPTPTANGAHGPDAGQESASPLDLHAVHRRHGIDEAALHANTATVEHLRNTAQHTPR